MHAVLKSIPWAAAMILIAFGKAYGLVEPHTAQTMLVIFPVLMVVTTARRGGCFSRRDRQAPTQ